MIPHLCQVGWDFRDPDFGKRKETTMRIVDVREITQLIASPIRNAYIDFSKMTASLVAVITDVVRDGRPPSARAQLQRPLRSGRKRSPPSFPSRSTARYKYTHRPWVFT